MAGFTALLRKILITHRTYHQVTEFLFQCLAPTYSISSPWKSQKLAERIVSSSSPSFLSPYSLLPLQMKKTRVGCKNLSWASLRLPRIYVRIYTQVPLRIMSKLLHVCPVLLRFMFKNRTPALPLTHLSFLATLHTRAARFSE